MIAPTPKTSTAVAVLAAALLSLSGCGESAQAKANKQVCAVRSDISKQIRTLTGLNLTSSSANAAKASFEAIGRDVTQLKALAPKLDPARRRSVEAATHDFVTRVGAIATALGSKLSAANAAAQFRSALSQLAEAYNQTLASLSC
jgi:Ser/Thr protein kinase RdoA (MazF antagonist)